VKRGIRLSIVLALLTTTVLAGAPGAGAVSDRAAEHQRIVDFWTPERVAQAVPRDFVLDPDTGRFRPFAPPDGKGKPKPPSEPPPAYTSAEWTGEGTVQSTTGKVLFQMGRSYYVCSAGLVDEGVGGRSVVLTAAHCVFDESGRDKPTTPDDDRFAQNWMFIPDYDSDPVALDAGGSFCAQTPHGCWTAAALVVHTGYATAGGFNATATRYDFAFAVLGVGGHDQLSQADSLGSQPISFDPVDTTESNTVFAFGYPAASPFDGKVLWYCSATVGLDPLNNDQTYRLPCNMTGGSSGGPWFSPFSSGSGTLVSVNSYGYSSVEAMHGPIFNAATQALYTAALTADANTKVP
jgi:hypothetical protein